MLVINTGHWTANLPDGWTQGPEEDGPLYFESGDQTAGAYFSTWQILDEPVAVAMKEMREAQRGALEEQSPGKWKLLAQSDSEADGVFVSRTELLNEENAHRIETRALGRGDMYVVVSYHDYDCTDLERSRLLSVPWLNSLVLEGGA